MQQVLYPLGNSLEDVKSRLKQKNQVIWIAEDGVVYEEPSDMYAYKHYYNENFLNPSDISDTSDSSDVSVITDAKDLKKKKKKKIR
ncbi:hypothetical protein RirG_063510 [Rhizophagus irregularis DAOM 197198w]|uniref:Uncharacterized protein n=1 Tax=Rhizophagus irregularis (strain DAOM 197198w) TaxID=1432141 RepID=A0A015LK68_RHIIW|nr:hypothetical protein RirG_063510 [Rhizophagus irregularis DAOM 197198w]